MIILRHLTAASRLNKQTRPSIFPRDILHSLLRSECTTLGDITMATLTVRSSVTVHGGRWQNSWINCRSRADILQLFSHPCGYIILYSLAPNEWSKSCYCSPNGCVGHTCVGYIKTHAILEQHPKQNETATHYYVYVKISHSYASLSSHSIFRFVFGLPSPFPSLPFHLHLFYLAFSPLPTYCADRTQVQYIKLPCGRVPDKLDRLIGFYSHFTPTCKAAKLRLPLSNDCTAKIYHVFKKWLITFEEALRWLSVVHQL